eukprot:2631466-Karenia_brevis.AAC.1
MIGFDMAIPHVVLWQCGHLGVRIGEAAHPGPDGPMCALRASQPSQVEEEAAMETASCAPSLDELMPPADEEAQDGA